MAKGEVNRKKFVKALVSGKTKQQAAIEAGYSPKTAASQASHLLKNSQIKSDLQKALEKAGLTDSRLAQKHIQLLDAQKTVSAVSGKDAGSGSVDFVDVPDYQTQSKALDMAYRLRGAYIEKVEMEHSGSVSFAVEVVDYSKSVRPKNGSGS